VLAAVSGMLLVRGVARVSTDGDLELAPPRARLDNGKTITRLMFCVTAPTICVQLHYFPLSI